MKNRQFLYLIIVGLLILAGAGIGHYYWTVPDYLAALLIDIGIGFILVAVILWNGNSKAKI